MPVPKKGRCTGLKTALRPCQSASLAPGILGGARTGTVQGTEGARLAPGGESGDRDRPPLFSAMGAGGGTGQRRAYEGA